MAEDIEQPTGRPLEADSENADRRTFLKTVGGAFAAAAVTGSGAPAASASAARQMGGGSQSHGPARKIPIGVFDPVYSDLSLDEMLDKISALGIEAVEIGTGGYPGNSALPDRRPPRRSGKPKAWKKKFDDRNILVATLSCHGNPVHPDADRAARCDTSAAPSCSRKSWKSR